MAKKVFVGNLPYVVGDDQLREGFGAYGEVVSAKIVLDRETQRPRGFGFVEFTTDEAAQASIDGLNGQEFHGRAITVREAEDRRRGPGPGGGGFGGPGAPSRPSRPPGAGPGYGGGGFRSGRESEDGHRGSRDGGGFRSGGYGGAAPRPSAHGYDAPAAPPFEGADEPRRREKKKRKTGQGERDWDREGSAGGNRREKRRQQNYMDYADLDDDLDKDDLGKDDLDKDDLDKDDAV